MTSRRYSLVTIALALGHGYAAKAPLSIQEDQGVARKGEIVTSGVPFAAGALQVGAPARVEDARGRPLPTQTKVLAQWADGSVRWLLVQFPASVAAGARTAYVVRSGMGPGPGHSRSVTIQEDGAGIRVSTGTFHVMFPRRDLTVVPTLVAGSVRTSAGQFTVTLDNGAVHSLSNAVAEQVVVEERGPLRATVRVSGWLKGPDGARWFKLDTRFRMHAGLASVKAEHTFLAMGGPRLHRIRQIAITVPAALGKHPRASLPTGGQPLVASLAEGTGVSLRANLDLTSHLREGDSERTLPKEVAGWAVLTGSRGSLGVAVRDFAYLADKEIEVRPTRLIIALWFEHAGRILDFGRSRARTHHVLYVLGASAVNAVQAFQNPLFASTDPQYLCDTSALGMLSPTGAPETTEYDRKIAMSFEHLQGQRRSNPKESGFVHYGDYHHGGYGNRATRGNLEYDLAHCAFLQFGRSGRRDYLDFALASNQHFVDMDINQETGDQLFHGYGANAELHREVTTRLEWGHVFADGPADAYYFTGDERSLEAIRRVADRVATIASSPGEETLRRIFAGAERQLGWPLLTLSRAYEVTGEKRYLLAARKVVRYLNDYARSPQEEYRRGVWWRSWMMDGCKVFMSGLLHEGLGSYYAATHDESVRETIVRGLDWLIDHMWAGEGFMYEFNAMNRPHRLDNYILLNMLAVDAFRFGYEMTGDRRYLSVALRAFWSRVREMQAPLDGKTFAIDARTSPRTAAYFVREKITGSNLPPSPRRLAQTGEPVPPRVRPDVMLAAALDGDFRYQLSGRAQDAVPVGKVEFVAGKKGKAIAVGSNGYLTLDVPPDLFHAPGTLAMWVKPNFQVNPLQPGPRAFFHIEGETPLIDSMAAVTIYGEVRVRLKDHVGHLNGTAEGNITKWQAGEWHHLALTWDRERVQLFLDGDQQQRANEGKYPGDGVTALPLGKQTRLHLGWRFGNWHCDTAIDELVIRGRALSPAEIRALMN